MIIRARAPLRLGLAGGGTDLPAYSSVYGGAVVNSTISLYAYATLTPLTGGRVELIPDHSLLRPVLHPSAAPTPLPLDGRADLLAATHNHVVRRYNHGQPLSCRIASRTDVPCGSGLGASSAIVVAALAAYLSWLGAPTDPFTLATAAVEIERTDLALAGGRQDQYAAAVGGMNFMEFRPDGIVVVNDLPLPRDVCHELSSLLILCFTGQSRASSLVISQQQRNLATSPAALAAMHSLKEEAVLLRSALLGADFPAIHALLRQSWESKQQTSSAILTERVASLYRAGMDAGAHCAKISGAGGGGFLFFLADLADRDRVAEALERAGGQVYRGVQFVGGGVEMWRA